ncbi:MAG TPA: FAD-dependent oxidoreductase [Streptosporangiaceae bacterium]|nr:FAD-dependent oxidoreductase [Streptosporangiaceae bacterium]
MRLVVVGGGIVGAACAWTASELGAEVILVDAALPGQATAAGAGIICPWSARADDPAWYALACISAREYPNLIERLAEAGEAEVSYRRVGALYLAGGERPGHERPDNESPEHERPDNERLAYERLESTRAALVSRRASAPEIGEIELLPPDQARDLFPPLRPGASAVLIGGAARVDGRLMAQALAGAARRRGAVVRHGRAAIEVGSGRVSGVTVDGERVGADAVVVAAGAWSGALLKSAGVAVPVRPQRGQIAHIGVPDADTSQWPVILPSGSGHYLLAFDDSRVVAGATREPDAGFDCRVTPAGVHEVLGEALAVAPGLGSGTLLETRVGLRPVGPDGLPLIGPVAGVGGLVVATGLGASGLTMGPYTGHLAARAALGLDPGMDLAPYDPLRGMAP